MNAAVQPRVRWLLPAVFLTPLAMGLLFFLGFPAFYSLYCRLTGTGLRPGLDARGSAVQVGTGRHVEVSLLAKVYDGLPLRFTSDATSARVEVGCDAMATFRLENLSDHPVSIRPIHQVAPRAAAEKFRMKMCFCYNDQVIEPRGRREYPVVFYLEPDLDPRVADGMICYSLFRIEPGAERSAEMKRIEAQVRDQGVILPPPGGALP